MRDLRRDYLRRVAPRLWPAPLDVSVGRRATTPADPSPGDRDYLILPGRRDPRLVVPADPRCASAGLRRYGLHRDGPGRWAADGLAAAIRFGLGPLVARNVLRVRGPAGEAADSIEAHLQSVLGSPVSVCFELAVSRRDRKPVLTVFDGNGVIAAFAKIGLDTLPARQVRAETRAIRTLAAAGLEHVCLPEILDAGTWRGVPVLVLAPLPVTRRRPDPAAVMAAQQELAAIGAQEPQPLAATAYWRGLDARVGSVAGSPSGAEIGGLFVRVAERFGDVPVALGAWHGDWSRWNTGWDGQRVLAWDWEHFEVGVPSGFDALHDALHEELVAVRSDPIRAARACLARAPEVLAPFGAAGRRADATAAAYALDVLTRWVSEGQADLGARLGDGTDWLLPALREWAALRTS